MRQKSRHLANGRKKIPSRSLPSIPQGEPELPPSPSTSVSTADSAIGPSTRMRRLSDNAMSAHRTVTGPVGEMHDADVAPATSSGRGASLQAEGRGAICGSDWRPSLSDAQPAQQKPRLRKSSAPHYPTRTAFSDPSYPPSQTSRCLRWWTSSKHYDPPSERRSRTDAVRPRTAPFSTLDQCAFCGSVLARRAIRWGLPKTIGSHPKVSSVGGSIAPDVRLLFSSDASNIHGKQKGRLYGLHTQKL
ncbi:hypothetical protein DSM109990_03497 (plasmid) [Sulfitobacter dubius]|uniref:Uncharacterized protein n=1 Tax=Sulfitobacter dubius TaxID=218673 RepID=A0ABY3ZUX4_9RHOB|nr:hypothetical protein DSM109990_03497 [Sulfitobacter dubius]